MGKFRLRGRWRKNREPRQDSVPLRAIVPNLVTSLAACCGIASISLSSEGRFGQALVALLIAAVCDGMDGRIARLLKASSKLGAELDSLADFVNFGVAPAMLVYFWVTGGPLHLGCNARVVQLTLGCALYYAMCDCFRLARFNTMLEQEPLPYWKKYFTGIPAPGGCWMVLTPVILSVQCSGWVPVKDGLAPADRLAQGDSPQRQAADAGLHGRGPPSDRRPGGGSLADAGGDGLPLLPDRADDGTVLPEGPFPLRTFASGGRIRTSRRGLTTRGHKG